MLVTTKEETFVSLSACSVIVPAEHESTDRFGRHLVGLAMFVVEQQGSRLLFKRRAQAIPCSVPADALLDWAADQLPIHGKVIGWNIDRVVMPTLLDAVESAAPLTAQRFLAKLHPLLSGGVIDISLDHGGAGAPPLAQVAADMAIFAPMWDPAAMLDAWQRGSVLEARRHGADEALAIWRMFVRSAGLAGLGAEDATEAWIERRKRMQQADGPGDERQVG